MATTIETNYVETLVENATFGQLKQPHIAADVDCGFPENAYVELKVVGGRVERVELWLMIRCV